MSGCPGYSAGPPPRAVCGTRAPVPENSHTHTHTPAVPMPVRVENGKSRVNSERIRAICACVEPYSYSPEYEYSLYDAITYVHEA